jgi:hypothetical protein
MGHWCNVDGSAVRSSPLALRPQEWAHSTSFWSDNLQCVTKSLDMPLCPPRIPHELLYNWNRVLALWHGHEGPHPPAQQGPSVQLTEPVRPIVSKRNTIAEGDMPPETRYLHEWICKVYKALRLGHMTQKCPAYVLLRWNKTRTEQRQG